MKISLSRPGLIQILLLIVIVLLAAIIIFEKFFNSASADIIELPAATVNAGFFTSLNNYNMDSAWIIPKKTPLEDEDSLWFNYKVDVPADLPVSLLIREIQNQFDTNEVSIFASEKESDRTTELKISSGGRLKLRALFSPNRSITRSTDTIAFVLSGIEDLNEENLTDLLFLPEHFAGILIPSKNSRELLKKLKENQKEAAILLNDNISELEFKLNTGYSAGRIKNSVLSIIRKFYDAAFFIIDEKSDIYNSVHYKMIKNEFTKRDLVLITKNNFIELSGTSGEEEMEAVRSHQKRGSIFLISAEDFLEMPPHLASLRKTGFKFVNPSYFINK